MHDGSGRHYFGVQWRPWAIGRSSNGDAAKHRAEDGMDIWTSRGGGAGGSNWDCLIHAASAKSEYSKLLIFTSSALHPEPVAR
jgi:hypothetical protein